MRNYTSPEYQLAVTLVIFQQGGQTPFGVPLHRVSPPLVQLTCNAEKLYE